jgi:hypothetical protein
MLPCLQVLPVGESLAAGLETEAGKSNNKNGVTILTSMVGLRGENIHQIKHAGLSVC